MSTPEKRTSTNNSAIYLVAGVGFAFFALSDDRLYTRAFASLVAIIFLVLAYRDWRTEQK